MSPTTRLVLASPSRASDAAFLAAADVAAVAAVLDAPYRLIGGNAVSLLVAAAGVSARVPARETADADFGAPYPVVADPRLLVELERRGYRRRSGNRFTRVHGADVDLVVDVLAPSHSGRLLPNQRHGRLVVDEVPGLALALSRPGVQVRVEVTLTSGVDLVAELVVPDVVSALALKAHAYLGRSSRRDAVDIWRLLEAAAASGFTATSWPREPTLTATATILRERFGAVGASGAGRASARPADQTRIRALVAQLVG